MVKENKKFLIIFSLLILGGLFLEVQPAYAFLDIPYNISTMQLDSLDFVENSILRFLVLLVLLVAESATFLVISAGLLDWASSLPSGLNQQLVTTGWGFTNSLASMFFILIFVAIAFSYIFKTETWGMQKALPKLIIIALLINFSLLFVQMTADIGWVAQNSFKSALFGTGPLKLASEAMGPLRDSMGSVIKLAASIPIGYLTLAAIPAPWLSVGGLLATGTMALGGEALFGMISQPIILIIFNFTAGLIFLAYAILFLVRIGVIWLLAITAPLAFLAFIMPQTEKYFKQWLQALFNWTFFGVVVFFVMGLGLKLFGFFATGETLTFAGLGGWNFPIVYYKYIFLFIYLIVALMFAKKFMPAGTEMVWSLGGIARDRGVKFAAEQTRKRGMGLTADWERGKKETATRAADKLTRGERLTFGEKLRVGFWTKKPEQALRVAQKSEMKEKFLREKILTEEKAKVLEKAPKDAEDRRQYLRTELFKEESRGIVRSLDKIAAIIDILAKEGKIGKDEERFIGDAVRRGVDPDKILERRPDLAPKLGKTIAETLEKISAEDARKKFQKEAYQNEEVVLHILKDETQFRDIERNAKMEIRKEIINTLKTRSLPITDPKDLQLFIKRMNEISRSPRWPKI